MAAVHGCCIKEQLHWLCKIVQFLLYYRMYVCMALATAASCVLLGADVMCWETLVRVIQFEEHMVLSSFITFVLNKGITLHIAIKINMHF